jgi:hypothetical protein
MGFLVAQQRAFAEAELAQHGVARRQGGCEQAVGPEGGLRPRLQGEGEAHVLHPELLVQPEAQVDGLIHYDACGNDDPGVDA